MWGVCDFMILYVLLWTSFFYWAWSRLFDRIWSGLRERCVERCLGPLVQSLSSNRQSKKAQMGMRHFDKHWRLLDDPQLRTLKHNFKLFVGCLENWKGGFQLMQILGLLGMYFDVVVVEVEKSLLFFRVALAILWS